MDNSPIKTAYLGSTATDYDQRRFSTPQGQYFDRIEYRELRRTLSRLQPSSKIMEVGCGTGRFTARVAKTEHAVLGIDPSPDMIEESRRRCAAFPATEFKIEEGAALSLADNAFDLTYSIRVTNQVGSRDYAMRMVRKMIRVTRPGGYILVEFMNEGRPEWLKRKRKDVRLRHEKLSVLASNEGCSVLEHSGILMGGEWVLKRTPAWLLPVWYAIETIAGRFLWRWTLRGYVLLRKS